MPKKNSLMIGVLFIMTIMLMTSSCNQATVSTPDDDVLSSFDVSLVEKTNDFGFSLYKNLATSNENIMISPISVSLALEMVYNGAAGETKAAMAKTLNLQGIDLETLNKNNLALLYFLSTTGPEIRLDLANSIWTHQDFQFSDHFLDTLMQDYQAEAQALDFSDPQSADTINQWVSTKTEDAINEIVSPPIDPQTIMFLINAVYFKGSWTDPFEVEATSDQPFTTANQETVMVAMMSKSDSLAYLKNSNFQAIKLPYGEDESLSMILFLPNDDSDLTTLQDQLNEKNWSEWMAGFEKKEGTIMVPKFKLEYEENLNQALSDLGMAIAFDGQKADFSAMAGSDSAGDIQISQVKHKTFIDVDEVGTEAAAVTSAEMSLTSMPMFDFELAFNRPFFYAIQDHESQAIIFMGSILDPRKIK